MSTRSNIAILNEDNSITSIYCHFDGYIDGVGKLLYDHYNTRDKVIKLIENGDITYLDESCECPDGHSFKTPKDGYTVYYGRDRNEMGCEPISFHKDELDHYFNNDYGYVFYSETNEWYVKGYETYGVWKQLKEFV